MWHTERERDVNVYNNVIVYTRDTIFLYIFSCISFSKGEKFLQKVVIAEIRDWTNSST